SLDLSRSRSAPARAPTVARRVALASRAGLHHVVSFSAATGGRHRRPWIAGNRAAAAAPPEPAHYGSHRWDGALRYLRQHFLPPAPGAACARAPAASSVVEVVDCCGCATADFVGAEIGRASCRERVEIA